MTNKTSFSHLGLFEGIGGFGVAIQKMGGTTLAYCEIDKWNLQLLAKKFPEAESYGDITTSCFKKYANRIDILTGGFPCQDISVAGKGIGIEGSRSGLWSEYKRAIKETNCRYIIAENSPNLLNKGFEKILLDLSEIGYDAEWECLSASDFGAFHKRERLYFIAYPNGHGFKGILSRLEKGRSILSKPSDKIVISSLPESFEHLGNHKRIRESNGVRDQLHRIKGLGNSIYPKVAMSIIKSIQDYEKLSA